jgi:penicillin-binding protein 1A
VDRISLYVQNPTGKTGTTQNQSDGWFMGMVPNLVTGVG